MKLTIKAIGIILCFVPLSVFGQYSYFKAARVVKTDSSVISGYVERISESDLSFGVRLKESLGGAKRQDIPIMDVDRVVFADDSSVFCKIKYVHSKDSDTICEYRLAKKLLDGYAELYKLQLPDSEVHIVYELSNTFVYIVKIDTNYHVLAQTEILDTVKGDGIERCLTCIGSEHKLIKSYINVLRRFFWDDKELMGRLKKLKLRDDQMIPLISDWNKKHPEIPRKALFERERAVVRHSVSLVPLSIINPDDPFYGFEIGYLVKIYNPNISEKISSDLGISFVSLFYIDADGNGMHSIGGCKFPVMLTYHCNNNEISPQAGLGFSFYVLRDAPVTFLRAALGLTFFKKFTMALAIEKDGFTSSSDTMWSLCFWFDFAQSIGSAARR
jgi:hypothetical protein